MTDLPSPVPQDRLAEIRQRLEVVKEVARIREIDIFNRAHRASWTDVDDLLSELDRLTAENARLKTLNEQSEKDRDAHVEEVWEDVLRAVQQAWPEPHNYCDSPTELVAEVINERDELKAENARLTSERQQLSPDEVSALIAGLEDARAGRIVPLDDIRHTLRSGDDVLRCMDCGAIYALFPLDTTLPDEQWRMIHDSDGGVLCASCIVRRAAKLPRVIALRAVIEFSDSRDELTEVRAQLAQAQQERDRANENLEAHVRAFDTDYARKVWQGKAEAAESQLTALQDQIAAQTGTVAECNRELVARADRLTALQARLTRLEDSLKACFNKHEASPIQHYGTCGFWRASEMCDCPVRDVAAALSAEPAVRDHAEMILKIDGENI